MSSSTSPIDLILEGAGAVDDINEHFNAASPAMTGALRLSTSGLLVWGYYGGRVNGMDVANGTVTLGASATSYIVMKKSDCTVSAATSTTNWNDSTNYWRLYSVVTGTTAVTSYNEERFSSTGLFGVGTVAMVNPMTAAADLIVGGASGVPTRLAAGSDTQVLTLVSGAVAWANSASGFSNPMTTAGDIIVGGASGAAARLAKGSSLQVLRMNSGATAQEWAAPVQAIPIACSDETTALTAGTAKVTFRMPFAFKVTAVRMSVTTAPTGATLLTIDIKESGTTILSTKLTIDASEKTSTTAATPPVISDPDLADDAEITIDINSVGSTIAGAGLKVYLIGYPA